jgi:hypothetical protein
VFPDDGFVVHAWSYDAWVQVARDHLTGNNKPIPDDLQQQMEEQLCMGLEPGWCLYDNDLRPRLNTSLDWGDVANALTTFSTWLSHGAKFVDKAESERRALICSRCHLNVNVSGCSNCHKLVQEVIGQRSSKYDYALKACGICHCMLRAKIHFEINDLAKDLHKHKDMYLQVPHCWMNENGQNFKSD